MSIGKMTVTYLVDEKYILHLQECNDGFQYHCFDMNEKKQMAEGLVEWGTMDHSPIVGILPGVRVAAFDEIGITAESVAKVSKEMLEQFPEGKKILYQMSKDPSFDSSEKSIRFITSEYDDKFKLPDGGVVEVTYPDRRFSMKCEYVDDYHMKLGYDVFHICQFAEMLERGGGTCRPEPIVMENEAAWDVGRKCFLAIQTSEDGYDYTLYRSDLSEIDGGQIDDPEKSINEIRDEILAEYSWDKKSMTPVDYEFLMECVDEKESAELSEKRASALETLNGLKSIQSHPSAGKHKQEVER